MSTKQVVLVHDTNCFGGLEIAVLELLRHLDTDRFRPHVLVPGYEEPHLASPTMFVQRVRHLGVPVLRPPHPGTTRGLSAARDIMNMSRLLTAAYTDIVHIHTARVEGARKAILAARAARVPLVLRTEHNSPSAFSARGRRARATTRVFDRWTDLIVTVSEHDREEQIREFGRSEAKTICCHNGVDVDRFQPADVRVAKQELGLDPDVPVVGAIGRLAPQKGLRYLIAAAATVLRVEKVRFVIVGDGEEECALRSEVAALGLDSHVTFTGYTPDPRPYIAAIDIGVLPSLHEGLSLTMLEFMASGKPTVVSDHPGLTEATIDGVTGLVVPRRDPHRLAEAIIQLVRDSAFAQRLGNAARARAVSEFSFDRHAQQVMRLYDRVNG